MTEKSKTSILVGLDAETLPSSDKMEFSYDKPFPTMDMVGEHGSLKDVDKIKEWKDKKLQSLIAEWTTKREKAKQDAEKEWRSEALKSYKCRVLCLAYANVLKNPDNIKVVDFANGEKEMLEEFYNDVKGYSVVQFLGQNLEFDLMVLFHRALHFKLHGLANVIRKDKGFTKSRDVELMELAGGGITFKYKIKLDAICELLGVKSPKDGINGSMVLDYYLDGKIDKIKEYCKEDVRSLIECYNILK